MSRWSRALPASRPKSRRCARSSTGCSARRCRCCPGGRRGGADARVDHADDAGDPPRRHLVYLDGPGHGRRDRDVHELRDDADRRLDRRSVRQPDVDGRAAPRRILRGARHRAGGARPARRDRSRPRARAGRSRTSPISYDGKRPAVADLCFTALPGETIALVGATGAGKSTALALLHRAFDPQSGRSRSTAWTSAALKLSGCATTSAWCSRRRCCSTARSPRTCWSASRTRPRGDARRLPRAQALDFVERNPDGFEASVGERGGSSRAASASASRSRARCSRIRRSSSSTRRPARSTPSPKPRCRRRSTR